MKNSKNKKDNKTKKKIRFTGLLFLILCIYLIIACIYYLFTLPIKNIVVTGNSLLSENDIKEIANINIGDSFIKLNPFSLKKTLENNNLIKIAKIKRDLSGSVNIIITENKILFSNVLNNEYVLEDSSTITDNNEYLGYPSLINYVPSNIYDEFIKEFSKIDLDIILMISEIEYNPEKYNDTVVDEDRFILRMNDGNIIYINIVNLEKLNSYKSIYSSLEKKGVLYLDSSSDNFIFKTAGE